MSSSSSNPIATPTRQSSQSRRSDGELLQSLRGLSLSTSPSAPTPSSLPPARSPNVNGSFRPAVDRSPSAMSVRAASRSSSFNSGARSSTPTLLRKASMNSLQSANSISRRSTSGNMSPTVSRAPASPAPPAPTANGVARTHFRGELENLHTVDAPGERHADTLVILHDACYGHRFSRPKTSRGALSTIVERPERIKACVLGVAAAYVLLGERHVDGEYPPHPDLNTANIPSVPFRIHKSTRRLPLLSPAVTNVHGAKWMEELKMMCDSAEAKLAMGGKELQRPEMNRGTDQDEPKKLHEGDLYLCSESLEAIEGSLGAVCDAVDAIFSEGGPKRAFVAVRPPGHHCSASYPSGFCWVNNVHVGIMHAILGHGLTHAAILDFDLHHGDGSQAITWQHNKRGVGLAKNAAFWKKASIGYYSLHDINSYPCEMGDEEKVKNASLCIDNAHGQHVWNVHLESWKTEAEFWELYEDKYTVLLDKARKYLKSHTERLRMANQTSKAAIFLSAGFDASEWEGAGMQRHSVNVPTSFYARIARDVTKIAEEEGNSVHGRVISVLEGGYSDRALTSGVLSHISGLAGSDPVDARERDGFGGDMGGLTGGVGVRRNSLELKLRPHAYDPSWWTSENLEMLESGVVLSPSTQRGPRNFTPGNYSSPTHSSTQKMVEVARLRKQASMSGLAPPRPPTPPPPEVHWNVAAHGLATVLTPTERRTTSCRPEDLSAEATRVRRERQMALDGFTDEQIAAALAPPPPPPASAAPVRKSLRERKVTKSYFESDDEDAVKNRRKTVAGPALLASEKGVSRSSTPQPNGRASTKQPGRRLSATPALSASDDTGPRPMTSMAQRPETSMSVRTTANTASLPLKKVRAPPVLKKEAVPRKEAALKKDVIPRAPRAKKPAAAAASKNGSKASSPSRPQSSRAGDNKGTDDLDNITSGIKKITLLTKQQKEARAREEKQAESAAGSDTVSSLPNTPDAETLSHQDMAIPVNGGNNRPNPPVTPMAEGLEHSTSNSAFVHYQPDGPIPETFTSEGPLNWLPVNTGLSPSPNKRRTPSPVKDQEFDSAANATTPSPGQQTDPAVSMSLSTTTPSPMKRGDVPIFTPTSQLRFAPRLAPDLSNVKTERKVDDPLWQVPETPE